MIIIRLNINSPADTSFLHFPMIIFDHWTYLSYHIVNIGKRFMYHNTGISRFRHVTLATLT